MKLHHDLKIIISLLAVFPALSGAADKWPGPPPDCWSGPRQVHAVADYGELWRKNIEITRSMGEMPADGVYSPNHGYLYATAGDFHPAGQITIYAEKEHLLLIRFTQLSGLSELRWINEKLIFMRPWWSRIAATDLIYDVEKETFIYAEDVTDGTQAYQQYLASCPLLGCECIKKQQEGPP